MPPTPPSPIHRAITAPLSFIAGATYPLRSLIFLQRHPRLWAIIALPIGLNLLLGVGLYVGVLLPGWNSIRQLTTQVLLRLPDWADGIAAVLGGILQGVLAVALFVAIGLLLVQFGAIFGAPWYGKLAETIEELRLGHLPPAEPLSLRGALRDVGRAIAFQLKKLLLAVGIGLPLLLLNLLPPFGTAIASVGGVTLAAVLVGLDFIDPPLERRRLRFRRKLGFLGQTLPTSASFSLVTLFLVSIPLLNLLMVPLCIMAGTLFCCDHILPQLTDVPPQRPEA